MSAYVLLRNSRNLRLFFSGQGLANVGNLIKQVTLSWLVYQLTESAILLGVVMFSRELAAFIISPFAGVVADRFNKHRLVMFSNVLLFINTSLLAILTIQAWVSVPVLVAIQLFYGLVSGLEIPTRQAFVNEMVEDKQLLTSAIALNSTLFNTARIVGPAIAGLLIPLVGEGFCFLIYSGMLLLILFFFSFLRYSPLPKSKARKGFQEEMQEGIQYMVKTPEIRLLIQLFAGVTFFGISYEMLLPIFADEVFKAGSQVFGYLTSAVGAGSIVGALLLSGKKNLRGLPIVLFGGVLIFGVFLALFSQIETLWLALVLLFFAGSGRVSVFTANNTLLQTMAGDEKRGRVLSLYIMVFMGCKTLGNLLMGFLADSWGAPFAVLLGGLSCILLILIMVPQYYFINRRVEEFEEEKEANCREVEGL